jgi:hypothetical protein
MHVLPRATPYHPLYHRPSPAISSSPVVHHHHHHHHRNHHQQIVVYVVYGSAAPQQSSLPAMGRLSLVSLGLFILPIAITVGTLVGYETYQASHGQQGLAPVPITGVKISTYCQKAFGVQPSQAQFICKSHHRVPFACPCSSVAPTICFAVGPHRGIC